MSDTFKTIRFANVLSELRPVHRKRVAELSRLLKNGERDLRARVDQETEDDAEAKAAIARLKEKAEAARAEAEAREDADVEAEADDAEVLTLDPTLRLNVPFPGLELPARGLGNERIVGPFRDLGGFEHRFRIARRGRWQTLTFADTKETAVLVPQRQAKADDGEIRVEFGKGTLWLAARLFDPDTSDAKAMLGLRVDRAEGTFKGDGRLALATPVTGEMKLSLAYPTGEIEACEGVGLIAPRDMTIRWRDGQVRVEIEGGAAILGATRIDLEGQSCEPQYDASRQRVVLPVKASPDGLSFSETGPRARGGRAGPTELPHPFVDFVGKAAIGFAGWALPVRTVANPNSLPPVQAVGGWLFHLDGEIVADWPGLLGAARFAKSVMEIATDGWFLMGQADTAGAWQINEAWPLPQGTTQHIYVRLPEEGVVAIGCGEDNGAFCGFTGVLTGRLSRPLDIAGRPLDLAETGVAALFQQKRGEPRSYALHALGPSRGDGGRIALENALIDVTPTQFESLRATLAGDTRLLRGAVRIRMTARAWMPILPDPYVANVAPSLHEGQPAPITAIVRWDDAPPEMMFSGALNEFAVRLEKPHAGGPWSHIATHDQFHEPGETRGTVGKPGGERRGGLTDQGRVTGWARKTGAQSSTQPGISARASYRAQPLDASQVIAASGLEAPPKPTIWADRMWQEITGGFRSPQIRLLDVSTNRDQIGVEIDPNLGVGPRGVQLEGLQVHTALNNVRVFALPQIQWEPVRTLDIDQKVEEIGIFPSPLAAPNDGGPTEIASSARRLSPIVPELWLDEAIDAFGAGHATTMVTTLPFGLHAYVDLQPRDQADREADSLRLLRPSFERGDGFGGALQLVVEAGHRRVSGPAADRAFAGLAYQEANGVALSTGQPLNISVLGETAEPESSLEALFNNEFAVERPKVPVTRLDICGYGGSTFSDWRNPLAAFAEAAKVQFQVLVGRTALEVVKFVSVLYPWGIRVTRTVEIERGTGAGILRRDSGWQAASDGLLDFTYMPEGASEPESDIYEVHPGLIRGVYSIERIRGADRPAYDLPEGGKVVAMYFDAEVEIGSSADNARRTAFRNVLGYLHLEPVGAPLNDRDLAVLLMQHGAAGGQTDTEIKIADTAFACRALRVEVGVADFDENGGPNNSGAVVLCGSVRAVPKFGPVGAWSVAAMAGPGNPDATGNSEAVADGVPIIVEGAAQSPAHGVIDAVYSGEIRFADPMDLLAGNLPQRDYAFVQSTPTHVFAYRRPTIPRASNTSTKRVNTALKPLFADIYARTTGGGVIPHPDNCIQLPGSAKLVVDGGTGRLKLSAPYNGPINRGPLELTDEGDIASRLYYNGQTLQFGLTETEWSVAMPRLSVWLDVFGVQEVTGMSFDLVGGSNRPNQLAQIDSLMLRELSDFMDMIPGFGSDRPGLPPVNLGASNVKVKAKVKTVAKIKIPIVPDTLDVTLEAKFEAGTEDVDVPDDPSRPPGAPATVAAPYIGGSLGAGLVGKVPAGPGYVLFGCELILGGKLVQPVTVDGVTTGELTKGYIELRALIGFQIGKSLGPFKAKSSIGVGPAVRYDGVWKYGGFLTLDAVVSVIIVELHIFAEFLALFFEKTGERMVYWEGEVGISVKVCWFLSIKMSVAVSDEEKL